MSRDIKFRAWSISPKYEISSEGRVFSNDYNHTGQRRELKQYLNEDGYPYVVLQVSGKRYKRMIHRLVAEEFLEKPSEFHQVNHKNGIRTDSFLENLEWVTHQENVIHGWRSNGRRHSEKHVKAISERTKGQSNPNAKLSIEEVLRLRDLRSHGESLKSIAKTFNISISQASAISRMKSWA